MNAFSDRVNRVHAERIFRVDQYTQIVLENCMDDKQRKLQELPSVDEILKSPRCIEWSGKYPRRLILSAVRQGIDSRRGRIINGIASDAPAEDILKDIELRLEALSLSSLRPVINATGIVLHTNLGRAILSDKIIDNIKAVAGGYSNLEYDTEKGRRGKRSTHIKKIIREITGAEDAIIVNNNAGAVLLCLNTLAANKEVIVSRGELVEIGGSFRLPDVMAASNAILREVGTTNKTHLYDYEKAIRENTGLILKVHRSNYMITGFTDEVSLAEFRPLSEKYNLPLMYDLGSGCLIDLRPYGIYSEPTVQEVVKAGADIITFSGDKLLGGPQGGIIAGSKKYIEKIEGNPLTRALRPDKLTLAAFEATLREYLDIEKAIENIPVLEMLLQTPEKIRGRAKRIAASLKRHLTDAGIDVVRDSSKAGGGSLPDADFQTYVVSIRPKGISVNDLEERLRKCTPPIIARIKGDALLVDARTVRDKEAAALVKGLTAAMNHS